MYQQYTDWAVKVGGGEQLLGELVNIKGHHSPLLILQTMSKAF